jgi:hypothetical protein
MFSFSLKFIILYGFFVTLTISIGHLSESELRKGINVALQWKKLKFDQREDMVKNLLQMPNFNQKLQNELINAITLSRILSNNERKSLMKNILIKGKQAFQDG